MTRAWVSRWKGFAAIAVVLCALLVGAVGAACARAEAGGATVIVKGPPDETEIREAEERRERERIERENAERESATPPAIPPEPTPTPCMVPALHGLSLAAAKARLRAAHCGVGQVYLAAGATAGKGRVVKQFRAAGTELAAEAPVAVKLAPAGRS